MYTFKQSLKTIWNQDWKEYAHYWEYLLPDIFGDLPLPTTHMDPVQNYPNIKNSTVQQIMAIN